VVMFCAESSDVVFLSLLCFSLVIFLFYVFIVYLYSSLQCFDTVGWAAGRASGL